MTYTQLAVLGVLVVVILDLAAFKTRLLTRRLFWVSYAIILFFQLAANGVLTGFKIVIYDEAAIVGDETTPFIGAGRIVFAPIEDVLFGFCLVLVTLTLWVWWGRRGVQREPSAGPPRWRE